MLHDIFFSIKAQCFLCLVWNFLPQDTFTVQYISSLVFWLAYASCAENIQGCQAFSLNDSLHFEFPIGREFPTFSPWIDVLSGLLLGRFREPHCILFDNWALSLCLILATSLRNTDSYCIIFHLHIFMVLANPPPLMESWRNISTKKKKGFSAN